MFESLLCFLNEVPSWLNQEHCALIFLSVSFILPRRVLFIDESDFFVELFTIAGDVCKTWAGCKGSWNYAQVFLGGGGGAGVTAYFLLSGWSIAGVLRIQCVCLFVLFIKEVRRDEVVHVAPVCLQLPSPDSDRSSATLPCCVFLKTNERLTL